MFHFCMFDVESNPPTEFVAVFGIFSKIIRSDCWKIVTDSNLLCLTVKKHPIIDDL